MGLIAVHHIHSKSSLSMSSSIGADIRRFFLCRFNHSWKAFMSSVANVFDDASGKVSCFRPSMLEKGFRLIRTLMICCSSFFDDLWLCNDGLALFPVLLSKF